MHEFVLTPNRPDPEIVIPTCRGDLRVLGWERNDIRVEVKGSADDVTAEQQNGRLALSSRSDLVLRVPRAASLTVGAAQGSVRVQAVEGRILMETVQGDLALRSVGAGQVGTVNGDLSAKGISGPLEVNLVQGDALVRDLEGPLRLGRVNGDLSARGLKAGGRAAEVQGDIRLGTLFAAGAEYRFRAQGDLICRIPPEANARLEVRCQGDLRSTVPGLVLVRENGVMTATLGAGAATVVLEAGGDLLLRPESERDVFDFKVGDFNVGIEVDVGQIQREAERIRREALREARRIHREAERAATHARHTMYGFGRWGRWFGMGMGEPPPTAGRGGEPVSDEERLMILRMVERGQISAAEAAKLLEALGD
ncbi:MAG: hypothetical protein C4311_10670 [Chloroflexota bacterium]